jgi:RHS repeat-associated protein
MKLFIRTLILLISIQLMGVSEEPPTPKSIESSETRITQSNLTAVPNAFVGMVNVITGDLVDQEVDLVIPGPNPIVIERSYSSSFNDYGSLEYGWDLNHSMRVRTTYDDSNFFFSGHIYSNFKANLNEGLGAITQFEGKRGSSRTTITQTSIDQGMTNCGKGEISGKTNPKNRYALLKNKKKQENWLLVEGTGTIHLFQGKSRVEDRDLELVKTTFPNGNHLSYHYDKKTDTSHCDLRTPQDWLLGEFKMSNQQLDKQKYEVRIDFLNGRNISYCFKGHGRGRNSLSKWKLSHVNRPDAPSVDYSYYQNSARIRKKAYPNNRYVNVAYWQKGHVDGSHIHSGDARINRVSGLAEPVDADESPVQTYRFSYELRPNGKEGKTKVYDAYENLTTYQYNSEQRLHHIEYYGDRPTFYRRESFFWGNGAQKGNLIAQRIDNQDGVALIARTLRYDDRGNPLTEHLYGNLTGQNTLSPELGNDFYAIPNGCEATVKVCTYSNDRCNSKLSEEENGQKTVYTYIAGKDQLEAKYIYDGNTIKKRHFYTYDLRGLQTSEIIDDGSSRDKNNMEGVQQRTKHLISGRNKAPVCLTEYEYQNYIDENGEEKRARHLFNIHDSFGRLLEQHHYDSGDNLRYRLHWEYDGQGNVIREVTAIGEEILRRYDENKNLIYEYGPSKDYHTDFAYDYMNRLIREEKVDHTNGKKYTTTHRYDRRSNRTATIDWIGNETTFTYDAFNRLVKTTYPPLPKPDGTLFYPEEIMGYNTLGHLSEITDKNGNLTVQKTTIRGQPFLIIYPDGSQEKMIYNLDGTLQQKIERNGMLTQYTYDYQQRPVFTQSSSITGEPLSSTHITYNAFNPIQEIDANGNVTTFHYDRLGRLSAVLKENTAEHYAYDPLGRRHQTKTYFGTHEDDYTLQIVEYDLLDRIIEERIEDASGTVLRKETCVYDKSGNKTQINTYSAAGIGTTTITYNIHSQPTRIIDPEGNTTTTHYLYDYKDVYGQSVSYAETTDPKGNVTITIGNTAGQTGMEQKKNTFGELIQQREYFYDGMGKLIQTKDTVFAPNHSPRIVINEWIYNAMGEVTDCIEGVGTPEQKHTSHRYNAYGQKESMQKPDGTQILYTYDGKGRLDTVSASDQTLSYTYAYDLNNNPIQVTDNIHLNDNKRVYDQHNRLIAETLGNGLHLTYTYDRQGRMLTVTLPDLTQVEYLYNATDLVEVKRLSNLGEVAYSQTYQYDQAGNLIQTTLPFELGKIDKTYDLLLRHRSTKALHFSETEIQYDPCGNLTSRAFSDPLGKLPCSYAYDDLYQLNKEEGLRSHTYQHDSLYNRVQRDGLQLQINALNQLLNDHKGNYSYDPNGNLAESSTQKYTYDAWDRLLSVTEENTQTTYQYDDQHRRLSKTSSVWDPITNTWIAKDTIYYLYLGQNEIGACDSQLNLTEVRILGYGRGAEIGAAVALELNGKVIIPLFDFAGNTRVLLDPTGHPLETYRYTAFGEENLSEKTLTAWRFSSKRTDTETGFVYFGRRYYNPHSGRWITADPIGYEAGPNLYAYVNNNPLRRIDLYGLRGREGRDWIEMRRDKKFYAELWQRPPRTRKPSLARHLENYEKIIPAAENSQTYTIKGKKLEFGGRFYYINGQVNTLEKSKENAQHLSDLAGGFEVTGIYNRTVNLPMDTFRSIIGWFGFTTTPCRLFVDEMTEFHNTAPEGVKAFVSVHSQAVIDVVNAARYLPPEVRDRILILAIAPADYALPDSYNSARHYRASAFRDFVPLPRLYRAALGGVDVKVLPSHPDANLHDHDFTSPTYEETIEKHTSNYVQSIGTSL